MNLHESKQLVIVVGAGPAGMAVTNELSKQGHEVVVLNRDIKFGGLAEYGIFPSKLKLRGGLKRQYWEVLNRPNVHYFGLVTIGKGKDLEVDDLRVLGPSAIVFATGAQGTKSIGIQGESAYGVYHAKDVVYYFNRLPVQTNRTFDMGRHVAVIGVGNVMVDIAHWLIRYRQVVSVTAIARRGPAERKFSSKDIKAISANIDLYVLGEEFSRIKPSIEAGGKDPEVVFKSMVEECRNGDLPVSQTRMGFRFFSAPHRVCTDSHHHVRALEIEETRYESGGSGDKVVGVKQFHEIPCDSVVFAVGDSIEASLGLPCKNGHVTTNPRKSEGNPEDMQYQVFDESSHAVWDGVFVTGWARKASEGLVGIAKRDGERCADVVGRYLETQPLLGLEKRTAILERLRGALLKNKVRAVSSEELQQVENRERTLAGHSDCIGEFKFASNQEMLECLRP